MARQITRCELKEGVVGRDPETSVLQSRWAKGHRELGNICSRPEKNWTGESASLRAHSLTDLGCNSQSQRRQSCVRLCKRETSHPTGTCRVSWAWQFCAGEHRDEANLRLSSSTSFASILNTPRSYIEMSTSSLQSKEIIGQGAVSSESQQQRYASLSCLCLSAL